MSSGPDWMAQAGLLLEGLRGAMSATPPNGEAGAPGGAAGEAHAPDCRWCPICQFGAVLRGERPEVSAALADVLTATSAALRAFAEDAGRAGSAAPAPEDPAPPPAPVQRIDIA